MKQNNISKPVLILSIISTVISVIALMAVIMVWCSLIYGGSGGGSHTAITNEAILGFSSAMFFLVVSWFIGIVGLLMGFVMFIVVLVKKNFKIIALPIVSFILALVPFIGPIVLLLYISM